MARYVLPGIIKYTRTRVGYVSLNIQELELVIGQVSLIIQELELVMWPGIINYTRTRVGHVARYH